MALVRAFLFIFLFFFEGYAFFRDPFPSGFSMADMGTIFWQNGIRGRQPWTPAAFMNDSLVFGIACGYTSFYAQMDNFSDLRISRVLGGLWYSSKRLKIKTALSFFNVLSMYGEQTGAISLGVDVFRFLRISGDFYATRSRLFILPERSESIVETGLSILIPFKRVAISTSLEHIPIWKSRRDKVTTDFTIRSGVHTVANQFGAQGFIIEVVPEQQRPLRLILGEEVFLTQWFSLRASVSTNPCFIGIGVTVEFKGGFADVSLVNNSDLGWSQGFSSAYGIRRQKKMQGNNCCP
ncbi:MAG: hypothetical protein GX640_15250 [Fibrobacter sp.]|nr:hypothetical protein [Fibrobacter sp.]